MHPNVTGLNGRSISILPMSDTTAFYIFLGAMLFVVTLAGIANGLLSTAGFWTNALTVGLLASILGLLIQAYRDERQHIRSTRDV